MCCKSSRVEMAFTVTVVGGVLFVYLLCTTTDLVEVRVGLGFSHPIEVLHVNKLEVEGEAGVWHLELRQLLDMRQVPQLFVAPVVQVT